MKAGSVCVCVLLTDPLVVLLLLDLLHLIQQLSHSQLQLSQLVLGCDFRVVVGVFSHLNVQMNPLEGEDKPGVSVRGRAGGSQKLLLSQDSHPQLQADGLRLSALLKTSCSVKLSSDETCRSHDPHQGHTHQHLNPDPPAFLLQTEPSWWSWSEGRSDVLLECER